MPNKQENYYLSTLEANYNRLTFTNDFMFCKILQNDPELCKELVELILDVKIREIVKLDKQEAIEITNDGKGVRLDVYLEDDENNVYDIEMQTYKRVDIPLRSRYYQAMMDLNLMRRGAKYNDLNKTYIVFISPFDQIGAGRCKYTFRNLCIENPEIELNDKSTKVFINPAGNTDGISDMLREFLMYLDTGEPTGDFTEKLQQKVVEAREQKKWRTEYMTLYDKFEDIREEALELGKELGKEIGREEGRESMACQMASLAGKLLEDNRLEDIGRLSDPKARDRLLSEYGLTSGRGQ